MAFSIAKTANWLHQVHRSRAVIGWWPDQFALEDERTAYKVQDALLKKLVLRSPIKPSFKKDVNFSERELQVLHLICEENTNAEIGKAIFLSPRSVEGIRQRLIEKTGVKNTVGLVIWAVRNGVV